MKLLADYHTHTVYSHGKGSVLDNAACAKQAGLKEISISDHGFSHPFFGVRRKELSALRSDCVEASEQTGVKVLMGIESNFISKDGQCDLREEDYDKFDVFLAGAHVCVKYKDISSFWNLCATSPTQKKWGIKPSADRIVKTTDMYINAVRTQPIDVITHLNYRVFADVKEVALACKECRTYIEINTKKTHMTDEEWSLVEQTGVSFVIGSDAHSPGRVADASDAFDLIKRVGIPLERVHNVDRLPDLRFAAYKGVKG